MGFPQVTSRLISAPVQALRAVFGGIGRVVTAADRPQDSYAGTAGGPAAPGQTARPDGRVSQGDRVTAMSGRGGAPPAPSRWRSLDETGNVRLLTAEDLDNGDIQSGNPEAGTATASETAATTAQAASSTSSDAATANGTSSDAATANGTSSDAATANGTASDLPLPGYDDLTLPSIRARLRGLDTAQLRALVAYESTHAERPEVLGMLERRIDKLEASG
jgi:hypothetical protein